ncbi:NAD(P)-dependent oxidoreductase [Devosia nitrariae]|uniref:Oxidoreductase n=1 Tax=Devosia nitrariae TaxID=2071872 RepID=A0ABQ5WDI8_9HYPH|nr:NAD(P)-dependent oxidoreductase [Devosia nitrariae]GLQ57661.1 oxidoreductase [Devosia nitrariae]
MAPTQEKPRLGFIGIGIMGAPMVRRLLAEGYKVTVWNREPERAREVVPVGAVWAENPAAVRAASDIVATCVIDGKAIETCCFGPDGLAAAASGADLLVDFSTVDPDVTVGLAERLEQSTGMAWLDAPVSGGPGPAEAGELTIMAGGRDGDFARATPMLASLAANLTHMGPLGAGQTAKLLNQAIVGVNYVLMAEVLALARSTALDAAALPRALAGGMADSTILQRIYAQMNSGDFHPPRGRAAQLDKDLRAVAVFAGKTGYSSPLIEQAVALYRAFADQAEADTDSAAISEWVVGGKH